MAVRSSVEEPLSTTVYGPSGRSAWLDVDWSAHRRRVTVRGRPMNVVEIGAGPPVLLVHGLSGSWQNWLENVCALARDHRVIAMDLPGFGGSAMPAAPLSIAGYADALDALCSQLCVDAAAVVGNSMGGFVGAELAIRHPQRVERLVLVAAAGISVQRLHNEPALAALHRAERLLALYGGWWASRSDVVARRPRLRRMLLGLVAAHPERLPGPLVAEQLRGSGKPGFVGAIDAMTSYPLRDRLGEIACPTLVVWGDRDRLVPLRDADEFVRLIPDARKVVYADTGHVPMLERPDRFNADVRAFLEEEPAAAGPLR